MSADMRGLRGSDATMALDLYMETLPGCTQMRLHERERDAGASHRFAYGQLVCFGCGKPVEAALAERLAAVEDALDKARDGFFLIQGGPVGQIVGAPCDGWCGGVAMSALAAIEERLASSPGQETRL